MSEYLISLSSCLPIFYSHKKSKAPQLTRGFALFMQLNHHVHFRNNVFHLAL